MTKLRPKTTGFFSPCCQTKQRVLRVYYMFCSGLRSLSNLPLSGCCLASVVLPAIWNSRLDLGRLKKAKQPKLEKSNQSRRAPPAAHDPSHHRHIAQHEAQRSVTVQSPPADRCPSIRSLHLHDLLPMTWYFTRFLSLTHSACRPDSVLSSGLW